jgi:hypothetical protein
MRPPAHACFGYRVQKVAEEWRWTAFDEAGGVRAEGRAASRAAAAAQVIAALAEAQLPTDRAA